MFFFRGLRAESVAHAAAGDFARFGIDVQFDELALRVACFHFVEAAIFKIDFANIGITGGLQFVVNLRNIQGRRGGGECGVLRLLDNENIARIGIHMQFHALALRILGLDFVIAVLFQLDLAHARVTGGFHAVVNLADIQGGRGGLPIRGGCRLRRGGLRQCVRNKSGTGGSDDKSGGGKGGANGGHGVFLSEKKRVD